MLKSWLELFRLPVTSPPSITDEAKNSKRHKSKVKYACIQSLCRPFALLLGSACADGALSGGRVMSDE